MLLLYLNKQHTYFTMPKTKPIKYILALALVGILYIACIKGHDTFMKDDDWGFGFLLIYGFGAGFCLLASAAALMFDKKKASLAYLTICFLNLSFIHIPIMTNFERFFLWFLIPVVMGIIMLYLHIKPANTN